MVNFLKKESTFTESRSEGNGFRAATSFTNAVESCAATSGLKRKHTGKIASSFIMQFFNSTNFIKPLV